MNQLEQKVAAKNFVRRWQAAEGNEDREARSFWIEFASEVLGITNPTHVLDFERRIQGRKCDVFHEDQRILIENKSRGVSLDETRHNNSYGDETPFQQALWYHQHLGSLAKPYWIVVCNFDEFRIYDMRHQLPAENDYISVTLESLVDNLHYFDFFTNSATSRMQVEKQLSIKAAELVGKLYDELSKQYLNLESDKHEQFSLNVAIVRLVFLLYAEDAGLLQKHQAFLEYMKRFDARQSRQALIDLFKVLNTPEDQRDPYIDPELNEFPYVNGALFANENIIVPQFTDQIRVDLLAEASAGFDWSGISPTIFGAAFESTLNPETRRAGGMHYTSIENIHKVIDPLFLDDLKEELVQIEGEKVAKRRNMMLRIFQQKLASINVFDPACGSGNFLTETYICLRKLENRVLADLQENGQGALGFGMGGNNSIMVNIGQLYGIEINDFAVAVAKTALWIAEAQAMEETQEIVFQVFDFLPLKNISNIHEGNALRMDWNDVLPPEKCSYVIGNPPFLGHISRTVEQTQELKDVWGRNDIGRLDYVSGWYKKATDYCSNATEWALVSTNSISQGEPVPKLFGYVFENGWRIKFAHRTFVWDSEANETAHVHVVIVGFTKKQGEAILFSYPDSKGEAIRMVVDNINGYLLPAPNVFIEKRREVLFPQLNPVTMGNMPRGEALIVEESDYESVMQDPIAAKYVRPFLMGRELIQGKKRYCLWMLDLEEGDVEKSAILKERIESVRISRESSSADSTRQMAATPHLFGQRAFIPENNYLGIPKVFSERRHYASCGFLSAEIIPGDKVYVCDDSDGFQFSMISSKFFILWQKAVGGRLKSDCSFSNTVVWNNFPVPEFSLENRKHVIECGKSVLDVRKQYPECSLADLYDPEGMPTDLLNAHKALDSAVEKAYGVDFNGDEEKIVAHLFKLYAEKVDSE